MQASTSVRHLLLPCHWSQRNTIVPDLIKCYGVCGRTIIFTETKNDANELAGALSEMIGARALHGDIPQSQREVRCLLCWPVAECSQMGIHAAACLSACLPACTLHLNHGPSLAELRAPPVGGASFERGPEPL